MIGRACICVVQTELFLEKSISEPALYLCCKSFVSSMAYGWPGPAGAGGLLREGFAGSLHRGALFWVKGGAGEEASVPGREARSGVWRPLSRGRKVAACGWEILFLWGGGFACSGRLDDHPAVARYAFWLAAGGWRLAAGGWRLVAGAGTGCWRRSLSGPRTPVPDAGQRSGCRDCDRDRSPWPVSLSFTEFPIMHILDAARQRYATKLYDPARKVPPEVVADLLEVLRLAPSSVNSQPWHFFVAESAEARDRIARSMEPRNPYNADKTRAASHVVVFCARTHLPDAHLDNVLAHEAAAGRFASPEARAQRTAVMNEYVRLHQETRHDGPEWTARQVYLALGFFLLAAASAGVDATPIEGFNEAALDEDLNLPAQDLRSLAIVTLGYHADGDLNATAAKSRLPKDEVFTFL